MFWSYVGILCYTLKKVSRCTPQGSHRGLFWTTFALFPISIRFMCLTQKRGALINAKVAHYLSMMGSFVYLDLNPAQLYYYTLQHVKGKLLHIAFLHINDKKMITLHLNASPFMPIYLLPLLNE